jgi:hypothetical protein
MTDSELRVLLDEAVAAGLETRCAPKLFGFYNTMLNRLDYRARVTSNYPEAVVFTIKAMHDRP